MSISSKISFIILFLFVACSKIHFYNSLPSEAVCSKSFDTILNGRYVLLDSVIKLKDEIYYNQYYFNNLFLSKDSCKIIKVDVFISTKKLFYDLQVLSYYNVNKIDTANLDLINKHRNEKRKDTDGYMVFEDMTSDTLLNLLNNDNIKNSMGKYYLNHFIAKHDWEVFQLELFEGNQLSINITNKEDERLLKKHIIKDQELFAKIVYISDSQFKTFVEKGGFRTRYRFKKLVDKIVINNTRDPRTKGIAILRPLNLTGNTLEQAIMD